MKKGRWFLAGAAAAILIAGSACGSGSVHVGETSAKRSAPAPTAAVSGGTDTASIQADLTGIDRDLGSVDGQLKQTDSDLSSSDEGDVQR